MPSGSGSEDQTAESERRDWFLGRGAPVGEGLDPPGTSAIELAATGFDVVELLELLGTGLRELHTVPADDCPYDTGNRSLLARARVAMEAGTVAADRFDRAYQRSTAADLLRIAEASLPPEPDPPVLVHGMAGLDAVRVDGGRIVGWSSLAWAGRGDAYRDLATMAVSLVDVVGPEALGPFIDAYGIDHPDVLRLDWHVVVDQLLR